MQIRYELTKDLLSIEVEAGYLHVSKIEIPIKDLAEVINQHNAPQRGRPRKEDKGEA